MAALKDLLRKVRKIVEYFHKSAEGVTLLGEILAATIEDHQVLIQQFLVQINQYLAQLSKFWYPFSGNWYTFSEK